MPEELAGLVLQRVTFTLSEWVFVGRGDGKLSFGKAAGEYFLYPATIPADHGPTERHRFQHGSAKGFRLRGQ